LGKLRRNRCKSRSKVAYTRHPDNSPPFPCKIRRNLTNWQTEHQPQHGLDCTIAKIWQIYEKPRFSMKNTIIFNCWTNLSIGKWILKKNTAKIPLNSFLSEISRFSIKKCFFCEKCKIMTIFGKNVNKENYGNIKLVQRCYFKQ